MGNFHTYHMAAKNKHVLILIRNCVVGIGFGLVGLLASYQRQKFPKTFLLVLEKTQFSATIFYGYPFFVDLLQLGHKAIY